MSYDEDAELTRYVWGHYAHLLSDFEQQVGRAAIGREKAAASGSPAMFLVLSERWGRSGDLDIDAALSSGPESFRRAACRRLLSERGVDVTINRCPQCRRVVRTPAARQCLWCGHDWHGPAA